MIHPFKPQTVSSMPSREWEHLVTKLTLSSGIAALEASLATEISIPLLLNFPPTTKRTLTTGYATDTHFPGQILEVINSYDHDFFLF